MTQSDYEKVLLALVLWREARGEPIDAKRAVAWSIRNRVNHPTWWGGDWATVITKKEQYSSMTHNGDPNCTKWPTATDTSWLACLEIAEAVYSESGTDPTNGATHYFDKSLDAAPPAWVASMVHTLDSGGFHFYKGA